MKQELKVDVIDFTQCVPSYQAETTSNTLKIILFYSTLAVYVTDIPELIVLTTVKKELKVDVIYFTQCVPSWSYQAETTFNTLKIVLFYALPLLFMTVAYWQIVRVLWKSDNIPGHSETVNIHAQTNNSLCNCK